MSHAIWSRFSRRWGAYRCIVPLTFMFSDAAMGLGHQFLIRGQWWCWWSCSLGSKAAFEAAVADMGYVTLGCRKKRVGQLTWCLSILASLPDGGWGTWGCTKGDGGEERGTCDRCRHTVKCHTFSCATHYVCACQSSGHVLYFSFWGVCCSMYVLMSLWYHCIVMLLLH